MTLYSLDGRAPVLPEDGECWVAPNAVVAGNVVLKRGASVWFGAVVRGDHEPPMVIGENTNVQDGSVLHTDEGIAMEIGAGVTVGHMAMLHGCTVGANSLIGIGAVLLNGVRVGANCIVGARTLLTEGKTIPDNSLVVGAPGRVIRQVTPEEVEMLRESAQHYVENWRRFRAGLQPV